MDLGVARARVLKSQLMASFLNATLNLKSGTANLKNRLATSFLDAALRRSPLLLNMLNTTDPEGRLTTFFTWLAYKSLKFKDGSDYYPPIPQKFNKKSILEKAEPQIDKLFAPKAYVKAFHDPWAEPTKVIRVSYEGESAKTEFYLKKHVNDFETGFRGASYQDVKGHSIVILGGIHLDGNKLLYHGIETIAQSKIKKRVNQQIPLAQKLYLDALRKSKTVEVFGYSLSSLLARDLAARLHAKATVFADIGLPGTYTNSQIRRAEINVTSLRLPDDCFTGQAGPQAMHGTRIDLPAISSKRVRSVAAEFDWPKPDDILKTHEAEVYYFVTRAMRHEEEANLQHALRMADAANSQPDRAPL